MGNGRLLIGVHFCVRVCVCVCGGGGYVYVYTCINSYCLLGVFVAKLFVQHGEFN